jgi:hypothetical protein
MDKKIKKSKESLLVPRLGMGTQLWPKLGLGTRNKYSLLEKLRLPYVSKNDTYWGNDMAGAPQQKSSQKLPETASADSGALQGPGFGTAHHRPGATAVAALWQNPRHGELLSLPY